ncbi:MAG: hypothetical protein JWR22_2655 [Herminiimonas sp.]|nr:hypothetical protein [Herminiimonas sp.]
MVRTCDCLRRTIMKTGMIAYFRAMHGHTQPEPDFEPGIRPEQPRPPDGTPRNPAPDNAPSQSPDKVPDGRPTPDVYPTGWTN